jgi:hypothetical protein
MVGEQHDREMTEPPEPTTRLISEAKLKVERLAEEIQKLKASLNSTPRTELNFRNQELASPQAPNPATKTNPFAVLGEDNSGVEALMKIHEDMKEGWSFQGRKRHAPKHASPRQEVHHPSPLISQRKTTPGGKRGLMHSEVHPSFFISLGIPVLPSKEPLRARVWPVLTREKNLKKETLVHSRNQALPNLPSYIRITGPVEAAETKWTQNSAWADLTQQLELELEENILRYKMCIKD